jgi:cellulose biosynthesis protein BcsQ
MKNKTIVIVFVSIKGGVGKTSVVIKLADCLAKAGMKVIMADSDLNDSLSSNRLEQDVREKTKKLNLASALSDVTNNLCDFAVPTTTPGIDLIASSPYLSDLRTISEKRLKHMIPSLYGKYDVMLIDCHPTYDNIVLNALHAADYAITPVLKDLFSYNAAVFLSEVLPRDVEGFENWFVLLNGYDRRYEESRTGRQSDFVELYKNSGLPLTPPSTWLPWTAGMYQTIDYHRPLSRRKDVPGAVYNEGLHAALGELAGSFFDDELTIPEVF